MRSESAEVAEIRRIPGRYPLEILRATYRRHAFARHFHDVHALGAIAGGAARFWCRRRSHVAGRDAAVFLPAGEVHDGVGVDDAAPLSYYMLYLPDAALRDATFLVPPSEALLAPPRTTAPGPAVHAALVAVWRCAGVGGDLLRLDDALLALLAAAAGHRDDDAPAPGARLPRDVARARDWLHAHFRDEVRLETLAAAAGTTPFRLAREFRRRLGLPPHAYLVQLRVDAARRLLRAGWPAGVVAQECGFYDQSQFTRHFRRHVGVTPGRFAAG